MMPTNLGTIKDAINYLQYLQAYSVAIPAYRVEEFINAIIMLVLHNLYVLVGDQHTSVAK